MKIIAIISLIIYSLSAQQTYHIVTSELTPGVKGNQIVLQLSNISSTESAENVDVKVIKQSANLKFNTTEEKVNNLNKKEEKEVAFSFDVIYSADITKADTVEFLITCGNATDNKTIHLTKQFIFTYSQPKEFSLEQNYPNPFNPATKIRYTIPGNVETRHGVSLRIYDILGNEVATLVNEEKQPGYYEIEFNASSPAFGGQAIASGVYIYRLAAGSFVATKKLMVLK
jgi:hypothetical protein